MALRVVGGFSPSGVAFIAVDLSLLVHTRTKLRFLCVHTSTITSLASDYLSATLALTPSTRNVPVDFDLLLLSIVELF